MISSSFPPLLFFLLLLFVFSLFSPVSGRPSSAVVCTYPDANDPIRSHPSTARTGNPNNFRFTLPTTAISPGTQTTITLTGATTFIGFLGYITDAAGKRVGSFVPSTFTDTSINLFTTCDTRTGSTRATLENKSSAAKGPTVSWGWQAPTTATNPLTINALVMTSFANYYYVTQTFNLAAAPATTTNAPATTLATTSSGAATTTRTTATTSKQGTTAAASTTARATTTSTVSPPVATTFLSPDLNYQLRWSRNSDDTIDFTMAIRGRGWVSVGICNGPKMTDQCDYITGWISAGKTTLIDTYSDGERIPLLDTANGGQSNVIEVSSSGAGDLDGTSITFRRKINTGDARDVAIVNAEQYIQWAYKSSLVGTETASSYGKHDAVGYFNVNLLAGGVASTNGPVTTSAPAAGVSSYTSAKNDFYAEWKTNSDGTIDITMATLGKGYVSIGICDGPEMKNKCDYITGWVNTNDEAILLDTSSDRYNQPPIDADVGGTNDVTLIASTNQGKLGGTSFTFRRKLSTGDAKDLAITNSVQYIQWAYSTAPLGPEVTKADYPIHDEYGVFQRNLLATDNNQQIPSTTTRSPATTTTKSGTTGPTRAPGVVSTYTSPDNKFYSEWKRNADGTMDILMETSGKGVVSIGICDGPAMKNKCDYIAGWFQGNNPLLIDSYSNRYAVPPVDADNGGTNDVELIDSNQNGATLGGTSITFRRKLNTGDTKGDVAIINDVQFIQWAYTDAPVPTTATPNNYPTHDGYGVFQTNLLSANAGIVTSQPDAVTTQPAGGTVSAFRFTAAGGRFSFNWEIIGDKLRLTMSAPTLGWISLGFCSGPRMPENCDYVTGGVDTATGQPYLYDTYGSQYDMPPLDTNGGGKNDYTLVPGTAVEKTEGGPFTSLTFERLLDTGDARDYLISDTNIECQWSYGDSDGNVAQQIIPIHPDGAFGNNFKINFIRGTSIDESQMEARISNGAWLLFISAALFGTWVVLRYARKAKKAYAGASMKSVVQNVYRDNDVYDPNSHKLFKNVSDRPVTTNQVAIDINQPGRHLRNASQQPFASKDAALQRWQQQWIPIQTEDGYTYYYNANLQETAWEIPPMPELFGRDTDAVLDYGTGAPRYSSNNNNYNNNNNNNYNNAKGSAPSALSAQLTLEAKKGGGFCSAFRVVCASRLPCTQLSASDLLLFGGFLALNALCFFALDNSPSTPKKLGYLASANFVLVCIPATRNSPLIWLLGFPFDRVIVFHRWLAPWTFAVTTGHMVAYINEWNKLNVNVNKLLFQDKENYYGFLSWVFTAVVLFTSWEYLRRRFFNFFYFAHFTFIAVFVLAYLHVPKQFLPYLFTIIVVYGLDRFVRFLWSIQCTSTVKLVPKDSDILLVRFRKNWLAKALNLYKIGQYVFINFPGVSPLAWHPFTLSSSPEEQTAEVHIRGLGDYTKKLIDQVKMNNGSPMMIRVDGPYGNHRFTYRRYPSLLLFGGGIGITPIVAMLRDIYRVGDFPAGTTRPPHVIQSIYVAWIVPNAEKYRWFQAELEQVWKTIAAEGDNPAVAGQPNGLPYLSIWVYASRDSEEKCNQWSANNMGTTFVSGKPDFDSIFQTVKNNHATQAVSVFACGPASLTSMVWDECSAMQTRGHRFDFHHETFDW